MSPPMKNNACVVTLHKTTSIKQVYKGLNENVIIMRGKEKYHVDFLNPRWMCEVLKHV
jgi:hypothetical protein